MTGAAPLPSGPVLLRRYANGRCGTTAFFRNRAFLETFTSLLVCLQQPTTRVLVHACSIGAEPYSLAMWWLHRACAAIQHMPGCTRSVVGLTAFHPDSIRADIEDAGFVAVDWNQEAIHRGWGHRVSPVVVPPESPDYSWRLSPFDPTAPDAMYRFGAIFRRHEQR